MIRFRALSLLAFAGVGSALSCGKSEDPFDNVGSSGAPAGTSGVGAGSAGRGGAGSAGVAQAGAIASGGSQAAGKGGGGTGGGGSGGSAGKGNTTGGNGASAGAGNGGAGGVAATGGAGDGGADGELCGGNVCGPAEFCCGPAECGTCAPLLTGPNCPMTCGSAGASGSGGQPSVCQEDCAASGFKCCDGACINPANDVENCGECGTRCTGPARYCDNGTCGEPECDSGTSCGGGEQCCGEECCDGGQLCCVVPGGPPQPPRCVDPVDATCPVGCPTCP
jgi:hypothetical protein